MVGGGETTGGQAAAARSDDEPAPTEQENSETSERQGSAADEWSRSDHSQGASWGDAGWHSRSWNRDWWGSVQPDSGGYDYDRGNYSTDAFSSNRSWSNGRPDDDYFGGDSRRGDGDPRAGPGDSEGVWRDPWDGGARHRAWHDSPDGGGTGDYGAGGGTHNLVWNGWRHFSNGGGTQPGGHGDQGGVQKGGAPRPSEKLSVPVFNGGDDEDVGTSARSYLRQVEAWRRLTYLPSNQQSLVLYRHFAGKAWVAAEELSVDALSRDDGVHYLTSWLRNRYLDLEVTRARRSPRCSASCAGSRGSRSATTMPNMIDYTLA